MASFHSANSDDARSGSAQSHPTRARTTPAPDSEHKHPEAPIVARVIHPDLFGRQRGKQFPASHLARLRSGGTAYSKMSLAEDLMGNPVPEADFPWLVGHPDLHASLDTEAFFPDWEPTGQWILSRLTENGMPSPLCARSQLAAAHERLQDAAGLNAIAAGEPEFYLFESGQKTPYPNGGVSYSMDRVGDPRGALGRLYRGLISFGIGVTAINREFSPGQFEVNLDHAPAELAADRAFLLKTAIKELASIEQLDANFMPKPLAHEEGSSLHMHVSLWDESGENAFATADGGLSDTCLAAVAGLQRHASALMAFAAPTINSYRRIHGAGLSPDTSSWAEDNRFAFIRIPAERGGATRIELRAGDASASPHLLLAAMLAAMTAGISEKLRPQGDEALPPSLDHALDALESDQVFRAAFGDEFLATYLAVKRSECRQHGAHVGDWEWDQYAGSV